MTKNNNTINYYFSIKTCKMLFILSFFPFFIAAQNQNRIDSLKNLVESYQEDTSKVFVLNKLCTVYGNIDYVKAIEYGNKALSLAKKLNAKKEIAISLNHIAGIYIYQGKYSVATTHLFQALKISEKIDDKLLTANILNNIGNIYYYQNNFKKAIEFYKKDLKIAKQLNDREGIAKSLYNIGNIYQSQKGKYNEAVKYFELALKTFEELNNQRGIAYLLNSLGSVNEEVEKYDEALIYFKKSLRKFKEIGDKKGIAATLAAIGIIYHKQKIYKNAIEYLDHALVIAKEIETKDIIMQIYRILGEIYSIQKNHKKAFEYERLYSQTKDSLLNETNQRQIAELQTKYETEKKEKQLEIQNLKLESNDLELKRRNTLIYAISGGFFLVLILAFVVFRGYKQSEKAKLIIEEKNKDITNSIHYAQNIQQAILPKEIEIKKAFSNHFIYFKPRDIVSGDFYWFTQKNEKIFIAACDCTGHGIPGAFVSMIGNDLLNQIIIERNIEEAGNILTHLNNGIKAVFTREGFEQEAQDGMDMALCVFNKNLNTLEFSGAKNPLILIKNGELKQIKGDINSIGGITEKNYHYKNHKITIQKGDSIYMFSDGYQDQFGGEKNKKFMIKRFKNLLLSIQDKTMPAQKAILHQTITDWKGSVPQIDDICVIGISV